MAPALFQTSSKTLSESRESLAHADPLLNGIPQLVVEGHHAHIRCPDLKIDFRATDLTKPLLGFVHHALTEAPALAIRRYGDQVKPASMPIESPDYRGHDPTIPLTDEE